MSQTLAICDYEELYVLRLAEYFTSHELLPFHVMAFNDCNKLENYIANNPLAVLLISSEMFYEGLYQLPIEQIILLSEDKSRLREESSYNISENSEERQTPQILKYQSANNIAKCLLEICTISKGNLMIPKKRNRQIKMIGIYSPVGRCLQTSFSLVLGQLLAQEKRCLYINMEPYSGFSSLFGKHFDNNMSDLLFFLKKGRERFVYKLKSTIEKIGKLEYIPPAENFLDLSDVDKETWQSFLEEIIVRTDYEVIILDLSDYIRGLFEILSSCDHIYTIIKKDGIAIAKQDQYEKMLSFSNQETILNKTKKCQFPIFKEIPKQIEKLPYSELAEYTKKLIKEDGL